MLVQHLREPLQGHHHICVVRFPFQNILKVRFLIFAALLAFQELAAAFELLCQNLRELSYVSSQESRFTSLKVMKITGYFPL